MLSNNMIHINISLVAITTDTHGNLSTYSVTHNASDFLSGAVTSGTYSSSFKLPRVHAGEVSGVLHTHNMAIVVIMCIFATITLIITVAIFVFCKKKNTVFTLPKPEEEEVDSVFEMEDMLSDTDTSEHDHEQNDMIQKSCTFPSMSRLCHYQAHSPLPSRKKGNRYGPSLRTFKKLLARSVAFSRRDRNTQHKSGPQISDTNSSPCNTNVFSKQNIVKRPTSLLLSHSLSDTTVWCPQHKTARACVRQGWCHTRPSKDSVPANGVSRAYVGQGEGILYQPLQDNTSTEPWQGSGKGDNCVWDEDVEGSSSATDTPMESPCSHDNESQIAVPLLQGDNSSCDTASIHMRTPQYSPLCLDWDGVSVSERLSSSQATNISSPSQSYHGNRLTSQHSVHHHGYTFHPVSHSEVPGCEGFPRGFPSILSKLEVQHDDTCAPAPHRPPPDSTHSPEHMVWQQSGTMETASGQSSPADIQGQLTFQWDTEV